MALAALAGSAPAEPVKVVVDGSRVGQRWEGWGATDLFSFDGVQVDREAGRPGVIPPDGRKATLKLYYHDLGMTRVRFWPMGYEPADAGGNPPRPGPNRFMWHGRGTRPVNSVDPFCEDHLVMGAQFRSPDEPFTFYPSAHQWESWMTVNPKGKWWWDPDAKFNPAMVGRYAEHAAAAVVHIRDKYGYELPYWSPFNEPSDNAKLSKETWLALVLACGREFKKQHVNTKLVICDNVTPEASAEAIEYVLANEEARGYMGAVSYHRYRGDFVLETVKPMLAKVLKGEPLVKSPVSFYDTAIKYGKSVWLSEQCSYGASGITRFDAGHTRANHICDEINVGKVNAFDFMLGYFVERGHNDETPILMHFNDGKFTGAEITPFGWWISQFTRYIRPGARQLAVALSSPLLGAVAFKHQAKKTLTLVVINNKPGPETISIQLDRLALGSQKLSRVRTSPGEFGRSLSDLEPRVGALEDCLPAISITTYIGTLAPGD